MSNLYNLTKTLHTLAQEKAKEHGLEIEIESDKIIYWDNFPEKPSDYHIGDSSMLVNAPDWFLKKAVLLIQEPQIRQILLTFFGVWEATDKDSIAKAQNPAFKNRAEELERRWLCFRTDLIDSTYITYPPLINSEPETVLTELITILESI